MSAATGCECWNRTTRAPALELTPPQAATGPCEEARPARHRPMETRIDRDGAEGIRLLHRPLIAGALDGIVIEGRDLALVHALGCEPCGDVDVAESFDVGEDLVGAGAADGACGLAGIANQHDAGAAVAGVGAEIDGANPDVAGYGERSGDALQSRQGRGQRLHRRAAKLAQPGIV